MKIHLLRPTLIDTPTGTKTGDFDMADETRANELVTKGYALAGHFGAKGPSAEQKTNGEAARVAALSAGGRSVSDDVVRGPNPRHATREPVPAKKAVLKPGTKRAVISKIKPGKGGGPKAKTKGKAR